MELLFRDQHLVVVNKPSGLSVHRGWDGDRMVAMSLLRDAIDQYVFPVHRLDRGTSGALLFALDGRTARALNEQFARCEIEKTYVALTRGIPPDEGLIDHPIPKN